LPEYFAKTGYRKPDNSVDAPFHYGHNTKQDMFTWLRDHPAIQKSFDSHMAGYSTDQPFWTNHYPVVPRLTQNLKSSKDSVLLVDLGGGLGNDLEEFKRRFPDLPGRLVLQEQEQVISQITRVNSSIEQAAHDFFAPQPIKGAKAYYLHNVLHDWNDEACRLIFQQIVPVLEKGYSKLLLNERVIPDSGASWEITSMDLTMMAMIAAQERTKRQWEELLGSAGFKIEGIWVPPGQPGEPCLIEAVFTGEITG
jgi:hypothetical protein